MGAVDLRPASTRLASTEGAPPGETGDSASAGPVPTRPASVGHPSAGPAPASRASTRPAPAEGVPSGETGNPAPASRASTGSGPVDDAPPAKEETPSPLLSPQMGRKEEDRLRQEANGKVQKAEQAVLQVDQSKLAKDQQETYTTIRSFIAEAREALSGQDFLRASNLAEKALALAEELVRTRR